MKYVVPFILITSLTACNTTNPHPYNGDLKRYNTVEQQRCPKARFTSVPKRLECKYQVREELNQPSLP